MAETGKRLLVIDDDSVILESIKRQLRDEPFEIVFEDNPESGLSRLDLERYDLVLCDIKMKPINGIEVLRTIKDRHHDVPVIIVSAFVDDQLFDEARAIGCEDFLIKPVPRRALKEAVSKALAKAD